MGFRNPRSDGSNADFGDQLHRNARLRIRVLQVINKLRQIFNRINIVMRRRRNQTNAGD